MRSTDVTLRDGTAASLFQTPDGAWACPICASAELSQAPYTHDGRGSFEMCSCGFEFGFDDDPGASREATDLVTENWNRWRERLLRTLRMHPAAFAEVAERLKAIGVQVEPLSR
jgi:hypothetical protein